MIPLPTPIYHISHAGNLPSIITRGGLICCSALRPSGINYVDIAHARIQDRRARTVVTHGPGGVLHDYVPFYFAPRSPMLYSISRGKVVGYDGGQAPVIHLVTTAQQVQAMGLQFAFTDGHGIMSLTNFFDDLDALDRVDWSIMRARQWAWANGDGDSGRRRQAEFLIWHVLPWSAILEIGVINATMQRVVNGLLSTERHQPPVRVHQDWYYQL